MVEDSLLLSRLARLVSEHLRRRLPSGVRWRLSVHPYDSVRERTAEVDEALHPDVWAWFSVIDGESNGPGLLGYYQLYSLEESLHWYRFAQESLNEPNFEFRPALQLPLTSSDGDGHYLDGRHGAVLYASRTDIPYPVFDSLSDLLEAWAVGWADGAYRLEDGYVEVDHDREQSIFARYRRAEGLLAQVELTAGRLDWDDDEAVRRLGAAGPDVVPELVRVARQRLERAPERGHPVWRVLADQADARATEILSLALERGGTEIQLPAAEGLARIRSEAAIEALEKAFRRGSDWVRENAQAARAFGVPLAGELDQLRLRIAASLGDIGAPSSDAVGVWGMDQPDRWLRVHGAQVLASTQSEQALASLRRGLTDADITVVASAARSLATLKDAESQELLIEALSQAGIDVLSAGSRRRRVDVGTVSHDVARALGVVSGPEVEPALRGLLEDFLMGVEGGSAPPDAATYFYPIYILIAAQEARCQLPSRLLERALEFFQEFLARLDRHQQHGLHVALPVVFELLAGSDGPEGDRAGRKWLAHPDAQIRREVVEGLGRGQASWRIAHLARASVDVDETVREAAQVGLTRADGPSADQARAEALEDSHPEVRWRGVIALAETLRVGSDASSILKSQLEDMTRDPHPAVAAQALFELAEQQLLTSVTLKKARGVHALTAAIADHLGLV